MYKVHIYSRPSTANIIYNIYKEQFIYKKICQPRFDYVQWHSEKYFIMLVVKPLWQMLFFNTLNTCEEWRLSFCSKIVLLHMFGYFTILSTSALYRKRILDSVCKIIITSNNSMSPKMSLSVLLLTHLAVILHWLCCSFLWVTDASVCLQGWRHEQGVLY